MSVGIGVLLELFGYGICNGCFAGPSLTGQPEDTRAGQCPIASPFGNVLQYLDTRSLRARFTLQALPFENGSVISLLGGMQILQGSSLSNSSVWFTGQEN